LCYIESAPGVRLLNGSEIDAPEPAVVDAMTRVAAGALDEEDLAEWIRTVMVEAP